MEANDEEEPTTQTMGITSLHIMMNPFKESIDRARERETQKENPDREQDDPTDD